MLRLGLKLPSQSHSKGNRKLVVYQTSVLGRRVGTHTPMARRNKGSFKLPGDTTFGVSFQTPEPAQIAGNSINRYYILQRSNSGTENGKKDHTSGVYPISQQTSPQDPSKPGTFMYRMIVLQFRGTAVRSYLVYSIGA
jgi:hypothetical protein